MAHPNLHPYRLSFPSEDQRIPISSYSSLANALGTDPGHESRQGRRPPPSYDAVDGKQAIYLNGPLVSNPTYPYPARSVFNPGRYPARTLLSVSNGRLPNDTNVAYSENSNRKRLLGLPQWYDCLPQPFFLEPDNARGLQAGPEFPSILFLRKGDKMPYSVWDVLTMNTMPDLADGDLPIFTCSPDRSIKIKLIWPGYSRYPLEKRIPIKRSSPLTPTLLLTMLADHIREFVRRMQNSNAVVELGQERWTVTEESGWKDCVITSLRHLGGSIWQPEIYCQRG